MDLNKKVLKNIGKRINVKMDDGKSIAGILKGYSGTSDYQADDILITPDEVGKPTSIPINSVTDIEPI